MPPRILIKHVNWLGDVVMTQPTLRAVRRAFPEARVTVLIKRELASFFDGAGWVDEVLPYQVRRGVAGQLDRFAIVRAIRERHFDIAVVLPDSFDAALWPFLARVPRRIGFRRDGRGLLLTDAIPRDPALLAGHQVHYRLHLVSAALGIPVDPDAFGLDVAATHLEAMGEWLAQRRPPSTRPLIALAVGAAFGPAKQWPAAHFATLIDLLAKRHGAQSVLVGAPTERARCDEVARLAHATPIVAAGETSIGQLIALLSLCDAFIGNDSGAMHVAAALGRPTIGIFGSTSPERTAPLGPHARVLRVPLDCSPCLQRTCRFGHYRCLTEISPEQVATALAADLA